MTQGGGEGTDRAASNKCSVNIYSEGNFLGTHSNKGQLASYDCMVDKLCARQYFVKLSGSILFYRFVIRLKWFGHRDTKERLGQTHQIPVLTNCSFKQTKRPPYTVVYRQNNKVFN